MGMWGGGAGAGGWSQGIGGQAMGPRASRNADGWDDDALGKVYDAQVVRRLIPYLMLYKRQAITAFTCMVVSAITSFLQPLMIGLIVRAGVQHNTGQIYLFSGIMGGMVVVNWLSAWLQQITTARMGNRLLLRLRTEMYEHMQGLSLSFYDEMEVGRMISRLTSDVTVMQELLTSGSLTHLRGRLRWAHRRHRDTVVHRLAAGARHVCHRAATCDSHGLVGRPRKAGIR